MARRSDFPTDRPIPGKTSDDPTTTRPPDELLSSIQ
jgi:hypothetical protein